MGICAAALIYNNVAVNFQITFSSNVQSFIFKCFLFFLPVAHICLQKIPIHHLFKNLKYLCYWFLQVEITCKYVLAPTIRLRNVLQW